MQLIDHHAVEATSQIITCVSFLFHHSLQSSVLVRAKSLQVARVVSIAVGNSAGRNETYNQQCRPDGVEHSPDEGFRGHAVRQRLALPLCLRVGCQHHVDADGDHHHGHEYGDDVRHGAEAGERLLLLEPRIGRGGPRLDDGDGDIAAAATATAVLQVYAKQQARPGAPVRFICRKRCCICWNHTRIPDFRRALQDRYATEY
ncbi:hypothetical protein BS78_02G152100 [Paspalum vaginatum]|nr:hypothetical protein BS78_02G152100 [Paspalum vaginatum]